MFVFYLHILMANDLKMIIPCQSQIINNKWWTWIFRGCPNIIHYKEIEPFFDFPTFYILSPVLIGERGFLLQESYACDTDTLHHCWLTVLQKLSRSSLLSPGFDGLIKTSIIIWDKNYKSRVLQYYLKKFYKHML